MFFGQQLFGAVFTSVGQNVLDNQLGNRLAGIPDTSPQLIQSTGATELLSHIPAEDHAAALVAYNDSLRVCFQVGLVMACLSILGALGMEWRSVKKNLPPKKPDGAQAAEEGKSLGDSREKEAQDGETGAATLAAVAADGEEDRNRDTTAAMLTVSTEAPRMASQTEVSAHVDASRAGNDRAEDRGEDKD